MPLLLCLKALSAHLPFLSGDRAHHSFLFISFPSLLMGFSLPKFFNSVTLDSFASLDTVSRGEKEMCVSQPNGIIAAIRRGESKPDDYFSYLCGQVARLYGM